MYLVQVFKSITGEEGMEEEEEEEEEEVKGRGRKEERGRRK